MSTKPKTPTIVEIGEDTILAILKSPTRSQELRVKLDNFWENKGSNGNDDWKRTEEECILIRVGARGGLRIPRNASVLTTVIEALEKAKGKFF